MGCVIMGCIAWTKYRVFVHAGTLPPSWQNMSAVEMSSMKVNGGLPPAFMRDSAAFTPVASSHTSTRSD